MRIAIIAPPWASVPPRAYGGTESALDGLARGLDGAGHDVFVFTTGDSTTPVERGHLFPRALDVVQQGQEAERRHVEAAYRHPGVRSADLVHDHTLLGPAYGAVHAGRPVVTTAHGPFRSECGPFYAAAAGRVPIIAISRHQASMAVGRVPVATVIHHGIDVDAIRPSRHHGGYAVFLGRVHPDKGVATAARIARAAGVPLVIAAKMREPLERQYFDAEVRPLLGGDIEFVGEVGATMKYMLLQGALALLNPIAWDEPFGMVMIEALACGTPVVAPPVASVPELVVDGITGILAPAADLAERLPAAAGIDRVACRADAERRFSLSRLAMDHTRFYEHVLEGDWPTAAVAQ